MATTTTTSAPPYHPAAGAGAATPVSSNTANNDNNNNDDVVMKKKSTFFLEYISKHTDLSQHEEQVSRQPYDVTSWLVYLDTLDDHIQTAAAATASAAASTATATANSSSTKQQASSSSSSSSSTTASSIISTTLCPLRDWIGRRAVALLPRSFKLWKNHWEFVLQACKNKWRLMMNDHNDSSSHNNNGNDDATSTVVLACFERCLMTLSDFPRVWVEYLTFIRAHPGCMSVTNMRRTINRSFQSLALTQHEKIWPVVLDWIIKTNSNKKKKNAALAKEDEQEEEGDLSRHLVTATPQVEQASLSWQIPLETRVRLLRRYCLCNPLYKREFAEFLVRHQRWGEAAVQYQALLNDSTVGGGGGAAASSNTTKRNDDWQAFATLCSQHPVQVHQAGVAWEAIVRSVVGGGSNNNDDDKNKRSTTTTDHPNKQDGSTVDAAATALDSGASASVFMEGILWTQLADSWIRRGSFEIARSIYEEGLQKVKTVRDFSILYNAYLQFEEGLLEAVTNSMNENDEDEEQEENKGSGGDDTTEENQEDWDILLEETASSKLADMELAMARAEHLTSRRPLMLNAVLLRQNPHNVGHWLERAHLHVQLDNDTDDHDEGLQQQEPPMTTTKKHRPGRQAAAAALEEALVTVLAAKAVNGSPSLLVTKLAKLYQDEEDVAKARDLFDRVCRQGVYQFQKVDDLADCWAAWIELELCNEAWDEALSLARQAVAAAPSAAAAMATSGRQTARRQLNSTKSLRLWDLLLDLEESLGTVQTTKDAYNRALEIKAATVQHVLNYASFLIDHEYYEESFTAYERGLELFSFPHHAGAKLLWKAYFTAFINRYSKTGNNSSSSKVERCRDLFQRCIEHCPPEESATFLMMQGEFEEAYGLTKRALSVYRQMCQTVPASEKHVAYQLWIAKTTKYLGLTATREIYQQAVETLKDQDAAKMCIEFANMETQLSEHERARAIWSYGAQMSDPRRLPEYWKAWNEFEIAHGNEETFREMLRIKRSVEAAFSTVNYNAMIVADQQPNLSDEQAMAMIASQEGVEHKASAPNSIAGFVPGSKRNVAAANLEDVEARAAKLRKAAGEAYAGQSRSSAGTGNDPDLGNDDQDEIDIDDIDAEIEAAAAAGAEAVAPATVEDVSTKTVPASVFGSLAVQDEQSAT